MNHEKLKEKIELILFANLNDEDNRPYTIATITEEILPLFKALEDKYVFAKEALEDIANGNRYGCERSDASCALDELKDE